MSDSHDEFDEIKQLFSSPCSEFTVLFWLWHGPINLSLRLHRHLLHDIRDDKFGKSFVDGCNSSN